MPASGIVPRRVTVAFFRCIGICCVPSFFRVFAPCAQEGLTAPPGCLQHAVLNIRQGRAFGLIRLILAGRQSRRRSLCEASGPGLSFVRPYYFAPTEKFTPGDKGGLVAESAFVGWQFDG